MAWTVLKTDGDLRDTNWERAALNASGIDLVEIQAERPEDVLAKASLAPQALMVLACPIDRRVMESLPSLKIISRYGIGVDMIDVTSATELGIAVTNVPDYCTDEVSSHTIALMVAIWRKIHLLDASVKAGTWETIRTAGEVRRLAGRTVGLVGFGRLGRAVARKLSTWGVTLLAYDPFAPDRLFQELGVTRMKSLEALLMASDIVSLHLSLTAETYHILNADTLSLMKPGAVLINTSRGALVDETALFAFLRQGKIAGAALDVMEKEPPDKGVFKGCEDKIILTPHAAYYSIESLEEVRREAVQAIIDFKNGVRPKNLVNLAVWERRR